MIQSFDVSSHRRLLEQFLVEDTGGCDVTTAATVRYDQQAAGRFVAKAPMVLAGLDIALEIFALLDPQFSAKPLRREGERLAPGDEPAEMRGRARALLSGERVALNLLQRLCGIATLTRMYADAVAGTKAEIFDTRKTTPGLRALEKYAVTVGGGRNHRWGLYDAVLVKENHIRMAGGAGRAARAVREIKDRVQFVEVEVTTIEELKEVINESPGMILLDNMAPGVVAEAVELVRASGKKILLEASGGITLANAREYAEAGVDRISIGALTHSAPAADISLEIEPLK